MLSASDIRQFGARSLFEQLGNEALNAPANTQYRFPDGFNAGLNTLLVWLAAAGSLGGVGQRSGGVHYTETNDRLITYAAPPANSDRLTMLSIASNLGFGGLACVNRPPAGAGAGPYTVTQNFASANELFVLHGGLLNRSSGALPQYNVALPNQFTFTAIPALNIVAFVLRSGPQGLISRSTLLNQGAFPGNVTSPVALDHKSNCILVFLDGLLLSENYDYTITTTTNIAISLVVAGANHVVQIVQIAASKAPNWRA